MRVSDAEVIDFSLMKPDRFTYTTIKTEQTLTVPIVPQLRKLLDQRIPKNVLAQDINEGIKIICEKIGMTEKILGYKSITEEESDNPKADTRKKPDYYEKWKLVSSHVGRRSTCTNALKLEISPGDVCSISGHSSEAMLYKYLKTTPTEKADLYLSAFEKGIKKLNQ